jgi:hypothetical protein
VLLHMTPTKHGINNGMTTITGRWIGHTNTIVYPWCLLGRKVLVDVLEFDIAHKIGRVFECLLVVEPPTQHRMMGK